MFHWQYSRNDILNFIQIYIHIYISVSIQYLSICLIPKGIEYLLHGHNLARFPIDSFPNDSVGLWRRNTRNFVIVFGHDINLVNFETVACTTICTDSSATNPLSEALFNFIFLRDMPLNVRTHLPWWSLPIVDKKTDFFAKFRRHHSTGKHCLKTPVERSARSRFSLVERYRWRHGRPSPFGRWP